MVGINKYLIYGLIGLSVFGYMYYLGEKVDTQATTITKLSDDLVAEQTKVIKMRDSIEDVQKRASELSKRYNGIDSKLSTRVTDLESKIGRGSVVVKKPTLVELKINKSYGEFADRFDCEMGITKCVK